MATNDFLLDWSDIYAFTCNSEGAKFIENVTVGFFYYN